MQNSSTDNMIESLSTSSDIYTSMIPAILEIDSTSTATNYIDEQFEMDFTQMDKFKEIYYRNHKSCGQKNLRCFPTCFNGHLENSFCGQPLRVILTMISKSQQDEEAIKTKLKLKDLVIIGEFQVQNICTDDATDGLILLSSIKIPNKNQTNEPLSDRSYIGKIIDIYPEINMGDEKVISSCVVEFNSECKGWHYAWIGSRFKSTDVKHVFAINIFTPTNITTTENEGNIINITGVEPISIIEKEMQKIVSFHSPAFIVASLRRNKEKQFIELNQPPKSRKRVENNTIKFVRGRAIKSTTTTNTSNTTTRKRRKVMLSNLSNDTLPTTTVASTHNDKAHILPSETSSGANKIATSCTTSSSLLADNDVVEIGTLLVYE